MRHMFSTSTRRAVVSLLMAGSFSGVAIGQPRDRDDRWDRFRNGRYDATTRPSVVDEGTYISVRARQSIRASRAEDRVYNAVVAEDVWDNDRRLAVPIIPRGAPVELRVRSARDGDLILDLDAVVVDGRRYLVDTAAVRAEGRVNDSHAGQIVGAGAIVGTIVGAIAGGGKGAAVGAVTGAAAGGVGVMARGRSLDVPSGAVITFRLDRDLIMAGQGGRRR